MPDQPAPEQAPERCPCGGKNRKWHHREGTPACDEIKAYERARERRRARYWTPGSPIQLPDTEYIL